MALRASSATVVGVEDSETANSAAPVGDPQSGRMDRKFIRDHRIIERYLSGRLPPKGALDFERFCRTHPELLDELALGERVHAALRLLEAGGHAPPWEVSPQRWWEKPRILIGATLVCALLATTNLMLLAKQSALRQAIAGLRDQMSAQRLEPTESSRSVAIQPNRTAPSLHSLASIGGHSAEFAELKISMAWSKFQLYQLAINRIDQGRVALIDHLQRDSNGDLRLALNTSALGPGDYQLTIEGLMWNGTPVPQAWATITIVH